MATKYQVTQLDKVLQKTKEGFPEWTNEKQLEWQLERQEEFHKQKLEAMAVKNAELYTDNVLLKREIEELKKPNHYEMANELLMRDIEVLKTKVKKGKDLISQLQKREETHKHIVPNLQAWRDRHADTIKEYDKLKSECHKDIERVWSIDTYPSLNSDGGDEKLLKQLKKERKEIIESVFYKIANKWID